jgi:signal transduction histidine kinase
MVAAAILLSLPFSSTAKDFYGYTNEHPLVIVCDWDFRPFEFLSSDGTPAGYNVEVLDLILDRLDIPHKFCMYEWHEATKLFEQRDADLIHALGFFYKSRPYVMTKKYLNYYNLRTVRRIDTPPLKRLSRLGPGDKVMIKQDDYAQLYLEDMKDRQFAIGYCSAKDGVTGVRSGRYQYYVWGETPLSNKIQELGLDSLTLEEIDIPAGELHIVGYDKYIIDLIDDQYTRLEQAGELQAIYDKWFHPERVHDDASPVSLLLVIGLSAAVLLTLLLAFITRRRAMNAIQRSTDINQMMGLALNMGEYYVVEWDFQNHILKNKYGNMMPDEGMRPEAFLQLLKPEDAQHFHNQNMRLAKGEINHFEIELSINKGTTGQPDWHIFYGQAIAERKDGKTSYLVYAAKDITRQREEDQRNRTLASKYKNIFETNLVAMSFYDAEGRLLDVNQKMRELCGISDDDSLFRSKLLFDFPCTKDAYPPGSREVMHVCTHLHLPQVGLDKYIETRIMPVFNDDGQLVYYISTSRNITAERNMYMKQREHDLRLREANEASNRYEEQMRYLLEESNMYVWHYDMRDRSILFSRSLRHSVFRITLDDYSNSLAEEHREEAMSVMRNFLLQGKPFSAIHRFQRPPEGVDISWFSIAGIPLSSDQDGTHEYFGLVRDISSLMKTQLRLREETTRAENSGKLKSAFLANMTHEIRTPLNAIVGFSGLLQVVEDASERREFLRIIRNNCDMLLRLINDILEASSMGQSMTIEPEPIDLPRVFDEICQTLAQRVEQSGVPFIKDNPYDSCAAVQDRGRLQQVLTNFVTNAVKYTTDGHIKVGYRMMSGEELSGITGRPSPAVQKGLYFYCEDTGIGIPKDKQAAVFERFVKLNDFVQGTGLGLSICKTIIEKCGGEIGVTGDVGIGSTFWFWVPLTVQVPSNT